MKRLVWVGQGRQVVKAVGISPLLLHGVNGQEKSVDGGGAGGATICGGLQVGRSVGVLFCLYCTSIWGSHHKSWTKKVLMFLVELLGLLRMF